MLLVSPISAALSSPSSPDMIGNSNDPGHIRDESTIEYISTVVSTKTITKDSSSSTENATPNGTSNTTAPSYLSSHDSVKILDVIPSNFSDIIIISKSEQSKVPSIAVQEGSSVGPSHLSNESSSSDNYPLEEEVQQLEVSNNNVIDLPEPLNQPNKTYGSNGSSFLSFEEWKRAKLSLESEKKTQQQSAIPKRSTPQTSKVVLGEEMEIDISNFFPQINNEPEGKVYKDKFNYASFDCGASIVKTNSEAKSATSVLFENKDSYMLNPCNAANQFIIIELCQDILVDSVVIGNFEFFSSTFKKFQISVSETFPVQSQNDWKTLGVFEAKDVRNFQSFNITNPMIWAKYFRLEFLDHYGSEYYCPLSIVRVHGRTMMQEFKQEEAFQKSQSLVQEPSNMEPNIEPISQDISGEDECFHHQHQLNVSEPGSDDHIPRPLNHDCNNERCKYNDKNANISELLKGIEFDECSVSLPQLKFEQIFKNYTLSRKCEPGVSSPKTSLTFPAAASIIPAVAVSPTAGTQESIYKNIMKRLSSLEANATLSVLYIEEQSKMISEAFTSLEKKHSTNLENIIKTFNDTITNEIYNFNNIFHFYQKHTAELFQSQLIEREQLLSSTTATMKELTNRLRSQKIWNFANSVVLLCVALYLLLTRNVELHMEDDEHCEQELDTAEEYTGLGLRYKSPIRRTFANLSRSRSPITPKFTSSSSSSVNIIELDNTPIKKVNTDGGSVSSTPSNGSNKENINQLINQKKKATHNKNNNKNKNKNNQNMNRPLSEKNTKSISPSLNSSNLVKEQTVDEDQENQEDYNNLPLYGQMDIPLTPRDTSDDDNSEDEH